MAGIMHRKGISSRHLPHEFSGLPKLAWTVCRFFELCKSFDFVIVRCNPGQIKADGGDQQKFDDGMREMRKLGKQVWPSPDVMEKMGCLLEVSRVWMKKTKNESP